jgi:hypothetical protein
VDETLAVVHTDIVTLPVRDTEAVELTVAEVHPETDPVEHVLGLLVTVRVPVWHTLSEAVVDTDGLKGGVWVPDPQALVVPLGIRELVELGVEEWHADAEGVVAEEGEERREGEGWAVKDSCIDAAGETEMQEEGELVRVGLAVMVGQPEGVIEVVGDRDMEGEDEVDGLGEGK